MRICPHCQYEMVGGFDARVEQTAKNIKISRGTGILAENIGKPKVAVCPKCGEVSLYIENIKKIS